MVLTMLDRQSSQVDCYDLFGVNFLSERTYSWGCIAKGSPMHAAREDVQQRCRGNCRLKPKEEVLPTCENAWSVKRGCGGKMCAKLSHSETCPRARLFPLRRMGQNAFLLPKMCIELSWLGVFLFVWVCVCAGKGVVVMVE